MSNYLFLSRDGSHPFSFFSLRWQKKQRKSKHLFLSNKLIKKINRISKLTIIISNTFFFFFPFGIYFVTTQVTETVKAVQQCFQQLSLVPAARKRVLTKTVHFGRSIDWHAESTSKIERAESYHLLSDALSQCPLVKCY